MVRNPRLMLVRRRMVSMSLMRYMRKMRVEMRLGRLVAATFGATTSSPTPTIIIFGT